MSLEIRYPRDLEPMYNVDTRIPIPYVLEPGIEQQQ